MRWKSVKPWERDYKSEFKYWTRENMKTTVTKTQTELSKLLRLDVHWPKEEIHVFAEGLSSLSDQRTESK